MVYKHAYLNTLVLLHSAFMLSVVKMPLKVEVGGHTLNSYGNCIVDHGKSWENHGIVFLNFCGNPVSRVSWVKSFRIIHEFKVFKLTIKLVSKY